MTLPTWLRHVRATRERNLFPGRGKRRKAPPPTLKLEVLEDRTLLATFLVLNTGDNGGVNPVPGAGTGTLRQAIVDADAAGTGTAANPDLIAFDIPTTDPGYNSTTGAFTIQPLSALPTITDTVVLDGYTQPGASPNTLTVGDNAVLTIVIDGSQAGAVDGLVIAGGNSTVRGLVIDNFVANGIYLTGNQDLVAGNLIGTDVTGESPNGNGYGITITGDSNTIGGTTAGARNIVSGSNGNDGDGIYIDGEFGGGNYNLVEGDYVGTDITGTTGLGNDFAGIWMSGSFNTIGGTTAGARNVISGNGSNNIVISGPGNFTDPNVASLNPTSNTVEGNYIGTDASGTHVIAGPREGILVQNGAYDNTIGGLTSTPGTGPGNVISGNPLAGIELGAEGYGPDITPLGARNNVIEGNLIGTDATGKVVLGNGEGIGILANDNTIGGTVAGSANVITGNSTLGIGIQGGTGNAILGNSIYANGNLGIELYPVGSPSSGNDNQAAPVLTGAALSSNGTTMSGTLASAASTTFRIEFFSNASPGPSGGDGQTYLGFATVSTDANGYLASSPDGSAVISNPDTPGASFTVSGLAAVPSGQAYLAATATNLSTDDTSEFSPECALLGVGATQLAVSGSNGAVVSNTGTFSDGIAGASVTLTASAGTVVQNNSNGTWTWSETTPSGPAQTGPVTIYAMDTYGQKAAAEFWLNVGSVFVITNTGDNGGVNPAPGAGTGTLRQAIVDADNAPAGTEPSLIAFDIASAGMQEIFLSASLPALTNPVIVDGSTEPGSQANSLPVQGAGAGDNAVWTVTVDGYLFGTGDGLTLAGGGSMVQGMYLTDFDSGIHLTTNGNDEVAGNYLPWPLSTGIFVDNVPNNTIGGTAPAARNVIGGGGGASAPYGVAGLWIDGAGATGNQVEGNYFGFDGTRPLFSPYGGGAYSFYDQTGVEIADGASNNVVGGTALGAGNVILAQTAGISMPYPKESSNLVQGNYIGLSPAGTLFPTGPQGGHGIFIRNGSDNTIGGTTASARNVIASTSSDVFIIGFPASSVATGNVIEGNFLGTNAAGSAALLPPNEEGRGIDVRGYSSTTTISHNLISGDVSALRAYPNNPMRR